MMSGMTAEPPAAARPTRTGGVVAMAVTGVSAVVTLLILASAVYVAAFFAAGFELGGFAWLSVAFLTLLGGVCGVATVYLGRRGLQELRRARSVADSTSG